MPASPVASHRGEAHGREAVHSFDGNAVTLSPCPPWCTDGRHSSDDELIYADHGCHHHGTEIEVPTSYKFPGTTDGPETIVRAVLKSWTRPLDAEPGPAFIELNIGTAPDHSDKYVKIILRSPGPSRWHCLTSRPRPNETGHAKRAPPAKRHRAERPDSAALADGRPGIPQPDRGRVCDQEGE
jgi:hypothetical protein